MKFLKNDTIALRAPSWRSLVAGLLVLVLAFQGYVTQSHIHKQTDVTRSIVSKVDGSSKPNKVPDNDDPANCPICQQISSAGQYVTPAWLVTFLILAAVSTTEIATFLIPRFDSVSHSWRGRGPPHH